MLSDADAARAVLPMVDKVAKKRNPGHQTMEEQAQPFVDRALAAVDAKLAERDKKAAEKQALSDLESQIAHAKANEDYTDEGIKNVLEIMQTQNVGNFETAKKVYRADHPAPSATPGNSPDRMDWNFYNEVNSGDMKGFFDGSVTNSPGITDDPVKWERAAAFKYLNGDIGLPTG
jgi:hypothetical protein